jgi:hypothetical protein
MGSNRNPRTIEEARTLVAHVESLFMPWNIPGLLAGFTDDCIIRFGDLPEFRGKAALEMLLRGRSERQKGYRLRKQLRAVMGIMRGGKIAVWEAAFNANEVGKPSSMGLT